MSLLLVLHESNLSIIGAGAATSSGTGTVTTTAALIGTGTAVSTGAATVFGPIALAGTGAALSNGTSGVTLLAALAATGAATSGGTASLLPTAQLVGTGAAVGAGTAAVTAYAAVAGTGAALSNGTAGANSSVPIAGTGAAVSTGVVNIVSLGIPIAGTGTATATGSGAPSATGILRGAGAASSAGTLLGFVPLALSGVGAATATGIVIHTMFGIAGRGAAFSGGTLIAPGYVAAVDHRAQLVWAPDLLPFTAIGEAQAGYPATNVTQPTKWRRVWRSAAPSDALTLQLAAPAALAGLALLNTNATAVTITVSSSSDFSSGVTVLVNAGAVTAHAPVAPRRQSWFPLAGPAVTYVRIAPVDLITGATAFEVGGVLVWATATTIPDACSPIRYTPRHGTLRLVGAAATETHAVATPVVERVLDGTAWTTSAMGATVARLAALGAGEAVLYLPDQADASAVFLVRREGTVNTGTRAATISAPVVLREVA